MEYVFELKYVQYIFITMTF